MLLATIWLYVFPFMVDRKMGLTDAMSASYHQVVDNGFWEHLALLVVFFAIGAVANGWIGLITTPFTIAVIVAAYFVVRRPRGPDRAPAGAARPGACDVLLAGADPAGPAVTPAAAPAAAAPETAAEATEPSPSLRRDRCRRGGDETAPGTAAETPTETVTDAPAEPEQPAGPAPEA